MNLNELRKISGNKRPSKRIGRGRGSGKGMHTVGRGNKGQKSRKGYNLPIGFEGGQVPLYKRLPTMGGFKNPLSKDIIIVKLSMLNDFKEGSEITPQLLLKSGIIKRIPKFGVKLLGNGKLTKKLTLKGFLVSDSAGKKTQKAGAILLNA